MPSRPGARVAALAPFIAGALAPYAVMPLPGAGWDVPLLLAGAGLTVLAALMVVAFPWQRGPGWAAVVPALVYLLAVGLTREAGGGNESGVGPMVMLPVMAMALYGTRRVLWVVLGGVALTYWLPIVVEGGERYPSSGWRLGALFLILSAALALAVQRLRDRIRAQADRLGELAHADELTGLPNRRAWIGTLEATLLDARRRGEPVCVALLDLDGFKRINDERGHAAGDELLVHVARGWSAVLRAGAQLARMGGDEFAIVLPGCEVAEALLVLERVRAVPAATSCSGGVVRWDGAEGSEELLRRADALLYEAKRRGRDRVVAEPLAVRS
jgi:diguanylate cyclase (GGDEF)-like protein